VLPEQLGGVLVVQPALPPHPRRTGREHLPQRARSVDHPRSVASPGRRDRPRAGQPAGMDDDGLRIVGTATTGPLYAGFTVLTDPDFLHRDQRAALTGLTSPGCRGRP
jgi:hypothetical protein